MLNENFLATEVYHAAFRVHDALGPGLLESAYEACLCYELFQAGIKVERQKSLPLVYHGVRLDAGYRIDLLVEGKLVVELKAVEFLATLHMAQMITYLRLSGCQLGLLINFNSPRLKDGVKRVIYTGGSECRRRSAY